MLKNPEKGTYSPKGTKNFLSYIPEILPNPINELFIFSDFVSDQAIERLKIFEKHNDGFHLADQDLRIRGPGDYIGTRQSGIEGFRFASLTDLEMLENARNQAKEIFLKDPTLSNDSYKNLKKELLKNFEERQLSVS